MKPLFISMLLFMPVPAVVDDGYTFRMPGGSVETAPDESETDFLKLQIEALQAEIESLKEKPEPEPEKAAEPADEWETVTETKYVKSNRAIYGGRVYTPQNYSKAYRCSQTGCGMCIDIVSQWNRMIPVTTTKRVKKTSSANTSSAKKTKTVTETRYRTQTVWACRNGRCGWYTDRIPYQVTVEVPVEDEEPAAEKPKEEKAKAETPRDLIGTPETVVSFVFDRIPLRRGSVFIDAGCGDGRVAIRAARRGLRAIGVEIDPKTVAIARDKAAGEDVAIFQGDALKWDYDGADTVFIYQHEDLTRDIVRRLPIGTRVISYMHNFPRCRARRLPVLVNGKTQYVYEGVIGDY